MSPVDLSIIVVNYETGPLLGNCLASVRRFAGDVTLECIVVDNASTDGSLEALRGFPEVQLVRNTTNVGFGRAVNAALRLAKGRYFLLLNPDTVIVSPVFRTLIASLEARPAVGIVGPRLINVDGSLQTSAYRFPTLFQAAGAVLGLKRVVPVELVRRVAGGRLGRHFGQLDPHLHPRPVDYVTGACMLVRREVVEQVGEFDERFFLYFEEKDFCLRASRQGWQVYFDPSAEVVHVIGGSSKGDPATTVVERFRSLRQYHDKHSGRVTRLLLRGLLLGGGALRLAGAMAARDRRRVRAWAAVVGLGFRTRGDRPRD